MEIQKFGTGQYESASIKPSVTSGKKDVLKKNWYEDTYTSPDAELDKIYHRNPVSSYFKNFAYSLRGGIAEGVSEAKQTISGIKCSEIPTVISVPLSFIASPVIAIGMLAYYGSEGLINGIKGEPNETLEKEKWNNARQYSYLYSTEGRI